ncbi:MAG TPA: sensor histidine kinase [Candidatus Scalindua sp.]|nr:sensor histidine kinase [Candidatus Scalindua sp.]
MFRNLKIRTKLTLTFVSLIVFSILAISYVGFHIAKKSLKSTRIAELKSISNLKVNRIETFFLERKGNIKTAQGYYNIKTNLPIVTQFANDRTNPAYIAAKRMLDGQLKTFQNVYGYKDFMLVSPGGKIVYVTNEAHAETDLDHPLPDPDGKAFEEGKEGTYISVVFLRIRNKMEGSDFGILITAPAHDFRGKFIGVIAFEVDMKPFYEFIQDTTGLGESGETLIGLNKGDHALFLNPLRHDAEAALKRKAIFGKIYAFPIQEAVQGRNGSGLSIDYRGKKIIAAWRHIPSLDWGLVAKIDTSEAFAIITHLRNITIIIAVTGIMAIVAIAVFLSKKVAKPIQKLIEGTRRISKGDLTYRINTKAMDEIGELAASFNEMTFQLGESKKKLNDYALSLEEKEEKYRTLVQTIPDIIYKIDENGCFTFLNNSIRTLGYEPEEIIGKHFSMILHPDDVESCSRSVVLQKYANKVTGDKKAPNFFDERRTKDRMTRNLEIRLMPKIHEGRESNTTGIKGPITSFCEVTATGDYEADVSIKDKKLLGTLGIIRDISEKIKLQAESIRAGQLAATGELAAGVAHEINNPIYGIINLAQLVVDESDKDSRAHKFGKLIMEEGNRIADLTKKLLSLSRSTTDKKRPVQIYELIPNSLKLTKVQLEKDNIIFKDNISKDIPAIIANPQEIHQVFLNLIQNARYALNEKYPDKDKDKILEISCNKVLIDDYEYVRIIFYDRGIGIPENILTKVISPFFTTKSPAKGTGIGLSISQNIISNHNGKMTIESIPGEFTKVVIDLPATELTIKK